MTTTTTAPSASPAAGGGRRVIQWEDVLPQRSLRVLLVEHDDSTRQVVTALLRKCGYYVVALADGTKAWEVMRDGIFSFDLVLTEVAMPTLSGIDLLSRIVAAEKCRNIPVIMMSSQDSIGLVLNCMRNGAVDFLVKPVRKNELRNLWQHVWRRQNMNSQTNASENNAASNHVSANAGNGSNTVENGNEESDAQTSDSKREMEIQCVENLEEIVTEQGAGLSRELGENQAGAKRGDVIVVPSPPDAPNGNISGINSVQEHSAEKNANSKFHHGTFAKVAGQLMDNALRNSDVSSHYPSDPGSDLLALLALKQLTADRKCKYSVMENNASVEIPLHEDSKGAAIGRADSCPPHFLEINPGEEWLYTNRKFRKKDIFNHSNSSAFSRYGDKRIRSSAQQPFSPSLCIAHHESVYDEDDALQPNEVLPSHQHTTGRSTIRIQVPLGSSSVREDAGISNPPPRKDCSSCPPFRFIPAPVPVGTALPYQNFGAGYGAVMQPIYYPQTPFMHCESAATENVAIQPAPRLSNYDENLSKPSQFDEHKQSASCSQVIHKGSGYTGSGETDAYTSVVVALQSGNETGVQSCSDRGHREAALKKFLKKRKDRCFEKKVRYQSRKKLAEQRPRVKGQFASHKLKSGTTDAETD